MVEIKIQVIKPNLEVNPIQDLNHKWVRLIKVNPSFFLKLKYYHLKKKLDEF